jgi:hypothetical protein
LENIEKAKSYLVSIGTIENYLRHNENGISPSPWKRSEIKKVNKVEEVDESHSFTN